MTIEERLEQVEKKLASLMDDGKRKVLRAQSDEEGKFGAEFSQYHTGPELKLVDKNNKVRARLFVNSNGVELVLLDENGERLWSAP